ncbi:YheC/YheD family endospore coat-associated protein [Paenibacillus darwinianus]|uniref:YheC/YheD family endospore coat-associated protein n=1 Tax=Paenibacillus darwinianus TaxID=1380763 RepID=UPI001CBEF622|nr:YheC/YheD family protein [Paenibacillus darwinianus]
MEANKVAHTELHFFAGKDVDFKERRIRAIHFNYADNKWERGILAFPDVVYVRGGSGKPVKQVIARLEQAGVKKINPIIAFNKGKLYQKLNLDKSVRSYLPATQSVENMDEIMSMLQKLGKVYVKACRGRKGTKVMRIEKLSGNRFLYSYSLLGALVRKTTYDRSSLQRAIRTFFKGKKVIVQKAIDLVRVDTNRLCDFRAEVQRNENGEIEIAGVAVRVGQKNSPITTHAGAYRYDTYLKKLFPQYSNQRIYGLLTRIRAFLMAIYRSVENTYGQFGEIGIDFAVDRNGKVWLIECNAQSAKVSFGKAYGEGARKGYLNPLQYAKTISRNNHRTHATQGGSSAQPDVANRRGASRGASFQGIGSRSYFDSRSGAVVGGRRTSQ